MKGKALSLIADFNISPLVGHLSHHTVMQDIAVNVAPFGQVYQALTGGEKQWGGVVWTAPERIFPGFNRVFNLEEADHAEIIAEVETFAQTLITAAKKQSYLFVISWTLPPSYRGYGMLDWRPGLGIRHLLAQMNLLLAERLSSCSNIFLLDAEKWLCQTAQVESPKMWYAAKVPYAPAVFEKAAADIAACVEGIKGKSRRLIIVDLDNTLWGGVIGETGWEGIRLGGHDHVGESYKDFQRELKALSNRGIQLAIVSKNDESVAMEALDNHPEMLLRRSDFAGWRINWQDKAANIVSLVEELNLGLASAVFIDDNPAERKRIAEAIPDILVPDWPQDSTGYVMALRALNCFQVASIGKEDRGRKAMYVADRTRREIKHDVGSVDEWLHRLGTCVCVSPINAANIARVTQLFNKTNQLNLTTRRLSEKDILDWAAAPNHSMLAVSVSDQFGDMGLVGIIGMEANGREGRLADFILSCRVMGRKVEETLIHLAVSELARLGAEVMKVQYLPTARNRPTLDVLHNAGLTKLNEHEFECSIASGYPKPDSVTLEIIQVAA